jgi:hypothetical protein
MLPKFVGIYVMAHAVNSRPIRLRNRPNHYFAKVLAVQEGPPQKFSADDGDGGGDWKSFDT